VSRGIAECRRCGAPLVTEQGESTAVASEPVTIEPVTTWPTMSLPSSAPERNVDLSGVVTVLLVADAATVLLAWAVPVLHYVFDVLCLATVVVFLIWLYGARTNVAPNQPQRLRRGWAIGAWFVPVFNLVVPVRIVADIARTDGQSNASLYATLAAWWSCWVLAWATGFRKVDQVVVLQDGSTFENRSLVITPGATLLSSLFTAAAAIMLVVVVHRITTQQARIAS
jgi:hypothetical protein